MYILLSSFKLVIWRRDILVNRNKKANKWQYAHLKCKCASSALDTPNWKSFIAVLKRNLYCLGFIAFDKLNQLFYVILMHSDYAIIKGKCTKWIFAFVVQLYPPTRQVIVLCFPADILAPTYFDYETFCAKDFCRRFSFMVKIRPWISTCVV